MRPRQTSRSGFSGTSKPCPCVNIYQELVSRSREEAPKSALLGETARTWPRAIFRVNCPGKPLYNSSARRSSLHGSRETRAGYGFFFKKIMPCLLYLKNYSTLLPVLPDFRRQWLQPRNCVRNRSVKRVGSADWSWFSLLETFLEIWSLKLKVMVFWE